MAREQEQFLDVVDRDEAERRWRAALPIVMPRVETIALREALGRVLAGDVASDTDVPAFDRSNFDGFAVRAADTYGASEDRPRALALNDEELATGICPRIEVGPGTATEIATGGMLPRGADAVVMVEQTRLDGDGLRIVRPVAPGTGVTFAGTDIARGELVLRRGTVLTSRETGVLAAIGCDHVDVYRCPRVAILSTGDEIVEPGKVLPPASIYDSNARVLADAVRELGGEPIELGIVGDDAGALWSAVERVHREADLLILSGGTSKGAGDLSYRILAGQQPGLVVHGVALKPGKPVCLGAIGRLPVAVLPGFPTSAVFTFHEFVAPLLRELGGRGDEAGVSVEARLPSRLNSEPGRTEYVLVGLVDGPDGYTAYPMGKGSGSVTAFGRADGFVTITKDEEYVEAGERVRVSLLARSLRPADLVVIGSHCVGLDLILGRLAERGTTSKTMWVGSQGGLVAAGRGECDVAGVHLLDPATGLYNRPLLPEGVRLVAGYERMQGIVFRPGDARFEGAGDDAGSIVSRVAAEPGCVMVNRNRGSGTRVVIDGLLGSARPAGWSVEARSHNAVAAAVAQGRADWGLAIEPVAMAYGLGFVRVRAECYDFAVPEARWDRPAVVQFREVLNEPATREALARLGFGPREETS